MSELNGLGMSLGNLSRLSKARTRSICAENPTGGKGMGAMAEPGPEGAARELGRGWKCRPKAIVEAGETLVLADIEGPGALQSMWFGGYVGRDFVLRIYWEEQDEPAVECPLPDFFALPWSVDRGNPMAGPFAPVNSLPVSVNPNHGLNCFWEMPFRQRCRVTIENLHPSEGRTCYHQINYTLTDVPDDCAYFHAQFRRTNPSPSSGLYTIVRARPEVPTQVPSPARYASGTRSVISVGNSAKSPALDTAPSAPASWERNTSAGDAEPSVRICDASSALRRPLSTCRGDLCRALWQRRCAAASAPGRGLDRGWRSLRSQPLLHGAP